MFVIYLALANGVFRSEDAGKSWMPLKEGLAHKKIRVLAAVEDTVFCGGPTMDSIVLMPRHGNSSSLLEPDMPEQKLPIHALAVAGHRIYAAVLRQFTSEVGAQVKATMMGSTWWSLLPINRFGRYVVRCRPQKKIRK